jgi:hypothetical protein
MIFPDQDPEEKRRREEEEHRRAWLAYEESMREIRDRSDRLLAQIEVRQREIEKRRDEIEDNALSLHGHRVYVDGDHYRNEQGRVLEGRDHDEATALHRAKPDASTWEEKQDIERRADDAKRLKENVNRELQEAEKSGQGLSADEQGRQRREAEQRITGYEKEFNDKVETTRSSAAAKAQGDLAATYSTDYAAAYGSAETGRTTSYAKAQAGEGQTLATNFTPAAEGQSGPEKKTVPQPPGQNGPNVQA